MYLCYCTDSNLMLGTNKSFDDEFGYLDTVLVAAARHNSITSNWSSEDDFITSGEDYESEAGSANNEATSQNSGSDGTKRTRGKKQKIELPKVMKNDIRRYFSRMFMNTINSADFINMQNFFNTFMTSECTFVSAQVLSPVFNVPDRLVASGPRQFAHYLLGCFVMYPDMVLTMSDTRIVTSSGWAGTKVVMDVDYHLTKIYDIPLETWVPPEDALADMYKAPTFKALVDAAHFNVEQEPDATEVLASQFAPDYTKTVGKKRRNRNKTARDAVTTEHIPQSYIQSLHEGAVLLKTPELLRVKGQFTVYLDENNHVQLVNLSGIQL